MIAFDMQPYNLVENEGFVGLMNLVEPRYQMPSRKYFTETVIPAINASVTTNIFMELEDNNGILFLVDTWTNEYTTHAYISLTAHWCSADFSLKSAVLSCEYFDEKHTADNLGTMFEKMLSKWNLDISDCHVVLHDNAHNITKCFHDLSVFHSSCFNHTLQLIANDSLKSFDEIGTLIKDCRSIFGHFKHSTSATAQLNEIQNQLYNANYKLIQDVCTRWNSTY